MATTAMTMRTVDVSSVIGELLQDEQSDLFFFMSTADPYINRAAADLRRPLQDMIERGTRQAGELVAVLEQLGGISRPVRRSAEIQCFAHLSVGFMRPRLYEAKRRSIGRYPRALRLIPASEPVVRGLLESPLAQRLGEM